MTTHYYQQNKNIVPSGGFTLIEFIVIISIFAIVASIALFNFSGFNSNISLANLTHDVALAIRGAQVYGISSVGDSNDIENPIPHGVYFKFVNANSGFANEIVVFDDIDGDFLHSSNETVDTMLIQSSDYISEIRYVPLGGQTLASCTDAAGVRILFTRPDPNPGIYCGMTPATHAEITISSNDNTRQKYINIEPTGQISIQ
jgi:type II secretory pathway pseudopilin PulG